MEYKGHKIGVERVHRTSVYDLSEPVSDETTPAEIWAFGEELIEGDEYDLGFVVLQPIKEDEDVYYDIIGGHFNTVRECKEFIDALE